MAPLSTGRKGYRLCKRSFDIVACLFVAPIATSIGLACALAIRAETPGPVLFAQDRTGRDGRRFRMWKFRTMVQDAEALKPGLQHLNVLPQPDFKILDDPRITRVGRFLRRTSLDELPQLWNVLRGEMTLVGPRPTSFRPETYRLWHMRRLEVTPGLTGLWQVRGRNTTTFDERLRLDIAYIDSMSMRRDLELLLATFSVIVRRRGA